MSMNQIPTLVLGIGGIGCQIAAAVSDSLSAEDKKYVSVIGVDTNVNDLAPLREKSGMVIIQTSDDMKVTEYLDRHPEYNEWFSSNDFLRERSMTNGAGQIRMLSRLAFLESVENSKFAPVLREITRIRKVDENPYNKSLNVIIAGSITGGTGAGLFLSIPFYLRNLLKTQAGLQSIVIRGMFVGPDIVEDVQPSKTNKDAVCVNGYTCLKELTAFNLRPVKSREVAKNLRLEFYDQEDGSVNNVPYDYLYLVEKSGDIGTMGDAKIAEIINYIGHVLFLLMFSPVTPNAQSIEDNFILSQINAGNMNRYAGAGMCRLTYPVNTAKEYVTLSIARELVQNEWLLIDQEFKARSKAANAKAKTDPTTVKPNIKTSYVELFRNDVLGDHAKLGMLAREAFTEKGSKYISKADDFVSAIDSKIADFMESPEVKAMEEGCKVDNSQMKNVADAEAQISRVWEGMRKYTQYAKHQINTKPGGFADDLFPVSKEVMNFHKDKAECIYNFLAKVHPVTARFLIYDIINSLDKKITDLSSLITGTDLYAYKNEDFDIKTEGVQGPDVAIAAISDKRHPIWNSLGPVGKVLSGEEKALRKLTRKLNDVSTAHVTTTSDYMGNSIKCSVCELVRERLLQLADDYAVFFNTVADKIERNNDNIKRLEDISFPYGQDGIYCSKDAFKRMVDEYMTEHPLELSENTKKAIFDQIYSVLARSFTADATVETKAAQKKRLLEARKKLESVFNKAVVETIRQDVEEHGFGIVNLTAREALAKEFELTSGLISEDDDYKEKYNEYVKKRIETAFKVAAPMLTTEHKTENTELFFLAVSPECAQTDAELKPDESETSHFYMRSTAQEAIVLINDEFDDTEITCVRINYNHTVEDLTKYQPGTRNALAYQERLSMLGQKNNLDANSDEILVVVNPHLDTAWSEEAFIPSMYEKQRRIDHEDCLKAFVYGCGFDSFKLINDDDHPDDAGRPRPTWYAFSGGLTIASRIMKCGEPIGNGYFDVYDAIPYNTRLKKAILANAASQIAGMKGYRSLEELVAEIGENWFVEDLAQPADKIDEGDKNIFDIFLEMRLQIPAEEWNELFRGLLITLWEFCEKLLGRNEKQINKCVGTILNKIYENCSVSRKPETEWNTGDRFLKNNYDNLLKQRYSVK